ncbi:MAG: NAD(P)/FAD-dependent oxidoreductase [Pseudomonadota bacterium]
MPPVAEKHDVVIIGGGHNGLTCACYLARAGLSVRVLERRSIVGGSAVTEEFHPGFRNSTASYTVSLLNPKVIADLNLAVHGLRIVERPIANFLPLSAQVGAFLKMGGGLGATQAEVARYSKRDAERLPAYYAMLEEAAQVMRGLALETPPNVGGGFAEILPALRTMKSVNKLSLPAKRNLLALFATSAGDLLDAWFESAPLKAALAFDAVVGNFASPYAPGSAYVLLHHVFGEVNGKPGQWGHVIGGMGAISDAMAAEARLRGVTIDCGAEVAKLMVRGGRATGVVLRDGREIAGRTVAANVNPRMLFLDLVEPREVEPDFLDRIKNYRCASATLRMNVALSELPQFACLPAAGLHHQSGIIMAPSLAYMEKAWFDARSGDMASQPIVEMLIPSTVDDTLAPAGSHVASLFCQHFNPVLASGKTWDERREAAADRVIDTVSGFVPNFRASVLGRMTLTPLDLERRFGLTGGDIFHGTLSLDQLFSARPVLGNANYRMPLAGLYLCGSGAHPGGGVTGLPGHNAAREIIRDFKRGRVR